MTTQDLINTLKQGKPMTDRLMREIVRELEEKTDQLHTMGTAMRAKDAEYVALREGVKRYFASCASKQRKCTDDMFDEEYTAWVKERLAARSEMDRLLGVLP